MLKHHFANSPNSYIDQQVFMAPYPDELKLRKKELREQSVEQLEVQGVLSIRAGLLRLEDPERPGDTLGRRKLLRIVRGGFRR